MCGLENAAHLKIPGYGWLLKMSNAIPVRKGEGRLPEPGACRREGVEIRPRRKDLGEDRRESEHGGSPAEAGIVGLAPLDEA